MAIVRMKDTRRDYYVGYSTATAVWHIIDQIISNDLHSDWEFRICVDRKQQNTFTLVLGCLRPLFVRSGRRVER